MNATKSIKSDRPALIEEKVRIKRAKQILRVFLELSENTDSIAKSSIDETLRWLEQCLLAHEIDTLILIARDFLGNKSKDAI